MSKTIDTIEGIGASYKEKFVAHGIKTVEALLEKGSTKAGRTAMAEATGVSEKMILTWVNMADLFRINGVAGQFAELLVASGVDTVKEFATRNPQNLFETLTTTNNEKHLTKVVPSAEKLTEFIEQAKNLSPMVTH